MRRLLRWIDMHPRTNAYIALVVTLDFLINIIERVF